MTTIKPASLGAISSGTLRDADLLAAFADELEYQLRRQSTRYPRAAARKLIREARRAILTEREVCNDLIEAIAEELNAFALPYGYFGNLPDDGACFGFFVNDPREEGFDGITVADTADVPRGYRGEVLHVNERGNMTLYVANGRGGLREVWGIV